MTVLLTIWQVLSIVMICMGYGFFLGWLRGKYKANNTEW